MRGYTTEWDKVSLNKAKSTIASQFNGEAGFKVTFDCGDYKTDSGTVTAHKDGQSFEVNFSSVNYGSTTVDINVSERYGYGKEYKTIGRITTDTDLYKSSLRKEFREYAQRRLNSILEEQITKPAKERSQKVSTKTFDKWLKETQPLIDKTDKVWEIRPRSDYNGRNHMNIGTDKLITKVKAYGTDKYPNTRQLFGVIHKSGIEVDNVNSNEIVLIGNGDQTVKFLKLLDSPYEWYEN